MAGQTKDTHPPFLQVFEILRRVGGATDANNEQAETWPVLATIRGGIKWASGAEQQEAGAMKVQARGKVTIWHYPGLTSSDRLRIKDTTRVFNLEAVIVPDELPQFMELDIVERR